MKIFFYFISIVPKPLFLALLDIYMAIGIFKRTLSYKVTKANIKIAYPNRTRSDIDLLSKLSIRETIISGFESIYAWGRNEAEVNSKILRVENNFLINTETQHISSY